MTLNPKKLLFILLGVSLTFGIIFLITQQFYNSNISGDLIWLLQVFNIDNEVSLPTWYSTILLFISALGLAYIAMTNKDQKSTKYWWGLSGIMTLASIDEGASLHERIDSLANLIGLRAIDANNTGLLFFDWWIFLLPILAIVAIFFIKFWLSLPKKTKLLFAASIAIFLIGSVFFEAIGGLIISSNELLEANPLVNAAEECFEMFGASLFIYAILDFIQSKNNLTWLALQNLIRNPNNSIIAQLSFNVELAKLILERHKLTPVFMGA
ncbi:MAG: hypothetical protein LBM97_01900 [Candidatus Nomurabacteria bacterium]|jgi:hypothetical protein|nr:hypothetical protein [Candidatus Nomurabacteria bacterium]